MFPAWIYLTAQLVSLRDTFNGMFNLEQMNPVGMLVIAALILLYEALGGLASVAWTDTIQGCIMCVAFVLLPLQLLSKWGSWEDIDVHHYPRKDFFDVPTAATRWILCNFIFEAFGFFSLPHMIQRVYAAGSMKSLKTGYAAMAVGAWLTQFVGVYIGTLGVKVLQGENGEYTEYPSAYSPIIEAVMNSSVFGYLLGIIVFTGSLAAIMSTADSLLIAISQLLTLEVLYAAKPSATPRQVRAQSSAFECHHLKRLVRSLFCPPAGARVREDLLHCFHVHRRGDRAGSCVWAE